MTNRYSLRSNVKPLASEAVANRFARIERLSDAVKTEFELVTARVGWFATSQAFIVAAFAQVASAEPHASGKPEVLKFLLFSLPWLGILASILVHVAVDAAHQAASLAKSQRDLAISQLPSELRYELVSAGSRLHKWGNLPAACLPFIVALFWLGAFGAMFA